MTATHLTIRVGDQAYGLQASSPDALVYFSRAYAACLGQPSEETGCFTLESAAGGGWQLHSDGVEFTRGPLGQVIRLLDWELARRATKLDSACTAFHAAWVMQGQHVVMMAGEGGSGKSHLCLQLLDQGFHCGAEDVTFFKGDWLTPFPRAIQLREDDPELQHVDPSRIFPGFDGRVCVEVRAKEAAAETDAGNLIVAFLDPAASGLMQPLTPLEGLQRLFGLCHRLDRLTQPLFETFTTLAAAGRMLVVPRRNALTAILDVLEI